MYTQCVYKIPDTNTKMDYLKVIGLGLSLLSLVLCEPPVEGYHYPNYQNTFNTPSTSYLPPKTGIGLPSSYLPPNSFTGSSHHNHGHNGNAGHDYSHAHGHGHENEVPKSYEFGYSVKDAQSGNNYDRREMSDGNIVRGEYRVHLPDGRTQIVTYHADWKNGYQANVRYEGQAKYPDTNTQGYNYNPPQFSGTQKGYHGNVNSFKPSPTYGPPGYH